MACIFSDWQETWHFCHRHNTISTPKAMVTEHKITEFFCNADVFCKVFAAQMANTPG